MQRCVKTVKRIDVLKTEWSDAHKEAKERLTTPVEICSDIGEMFNRNLDTSKENNPKRLNKILQNI